MSPRRTRGYLPAGRLERRSYRAEGSPLLFLAFGLVQAGVAALRDPASAAATSVAMILRGDFEVLETLWQGSYVLAGALLIVGVMIPYPVAEVLGEWLAIWAMSINCVALLIVRGFGGTGAALGAFLLAVAVCAVRIYVIHERARVAALERRRRQIAYGGPDRRQ